MIRTLAVLGVSNALVATPGMAGELILRTGRTRAEAIREANRAGHALAAERAGYCHPAERYDVFEHLGQWYAQVVVADHPGRGVGLHY